MEFSIRTAVVLLFQSFIIHASMYAERGVGEYGIRFSHFCGPVLSQSASGSDSLLQLSFGMNALRIKTYPSGTVSEETLPYHIARSKLPSQSTEFLKPPPIRQ